MEVHCDEGTISAIASPSQASRPFLTSPTSSAAALSPPDTSCHRFCPGYLYDHRRARMQSVIVDFAFIAKRLAEIRTARYQELGVSQPTTPKQSQSPAR